MSKALKEADVSKVSNASNEVIFSAGASAASASASVPVAKLPNPLIKLAQEDFSSQALKDALSVPGANLNEVTNTATGDIVARDLFNRHREMIKAGKAEQNSDMALLELLFKSGAVPNDKWGKEGGMFLSYAWKRAHELETFYGNPLPKANK